MSLYLKNLSKRTVPNPYRSLFIGILSRQVERFLYSFMIECTLIQLCGLEFDCNYRILIYQLVCSKSSESSESSKSITHDYLEVGPAKSE